MRLIDADKLESGEVIIPTENGGYEYVEVFFKDDVNNAPTIDAVPVRHGHWNVIDQAEPRRYGCSRCKRMRWTTENYCPCCGVKMDEEVQDDSI